MTEIPIDHVVSAAADPAPPHAVTDPAPEHGQRVTWAELFFDLVFAFAVTQIAAAGASPRLPQLAILGALVLLLVALNVFEGWTVASGRPMAIIRLGHGAIPAD